MLFDSVKAVSPVLTTVLLLLMVLGAAGGYTLYVTLMQGRIINQYEENVVYPVNPPQTMGIICYPGYGFLDVMNTSAGGIVGTVDYFVKSGDVVLSGQRTVNISNYGRIYFPIRGGVNTKVNFELYTPDWKITDYCTVREDKNLRLYLPFDEGAGTVTKDKSKYNGDVTVYEAEWDVGKSGHSLDFDGIDDYVEVSNSADLNLTDAISVLVWVKPTANDGAYQAFVSKDYAETWAILQYSNQDRFRAYLVTDAGSQSQEMAAFTAGNWYHVGFTYDQSSGELKLYVNGTQYGSTISTSGFIQTNSQTVGIARDGDSGYPADADIDEVRIYDEALPADAIYAIYEAYK